MQWPRFNLLPHLKAFLGRAEVPLRPDPPLQSRLLTGQARCNLGLLTALSIWVTGAGILAAPPTGSSASTPATEDQALRQTLSKLIQTATNSDIAFPRLAYLCDMFSPRFSGSTNLEAAIDWILGEARKDGLDNVHGEDVMVPHWVRGDESLTLVQPVARTLHMIGLGGSIGTPPDGIEAEILIVKSFEDLQQHSAEAKGKIVLFNAPFTSYGNTVQYRFGGAAEAAKLGAVASLVRSITPFSLQTPHTGVMRYQDGTTHIPNAAITLEDAEMLVRMQARGQRPALRLKMGAQMLPDARSRNVIAEILGREKPGEIVVVSGHIDSWDNTPGALDDGGGVMAAWEALRVMHEIGLRPRRTVRLVLWTNEENGFGGAMTYQRTHLAELPRHALVIESDIGVIKPSGFLCTMGDAAARESIKMSQLLLGIGTWTMNRGVAGGDLEPMVRQGVPCMALETRNDNYFWFHHTAADTPEKIKPSEINICAAAMAAMAYQAAETPDLLPR